MPIDRYQLEVWGVPYKFERVNLRTLEMLSTPLYAERLTVKDRQPERWAGFVASNGRFVRVTADVTRNVVRFEAASGRLSMEMLESWFRANVHAIDSLGYEVLQREPGVT